MMDSAADDLMTASIGRSPRNDPDPPGPHQADFHGLPLDNATKPASTEAQLRQYKDINLLLTFDSSPFDRSETRPIALHTATLPNMNPDQTSGSAAAEPSREAPPDAFPRDPADIPYTTRDSAAPASLQPPAEASVDLRHAHAQPGVLPGTSRPCLMLRRDAWSRALLRPSAFYCAASLVSG